jgi:hypothetical protein
MSAACQCGPDETPDLAATQAHIVATGCLSCHLAFDDELERERAAEQTAEAPR